MSALFEDNFELYGGDYLKLLDGVWASVDPTGVASQLVIPAWEEQDRYWIDLSARGAEIRCAFATGGLTALGLWGEFYFERLPAANDYVYLYSLVNSSNQLQAGVKLNTDGTLTLHGVAAGSTVATTSVPVIQAATTHKVQTQFNLGTGVVEIRVDGVTVMSLTTTALGTDTVVGYKHWRSDAPTPSDTTYHLKATCAYSLSGTYNNSWPAISGIKTVLINSDTAVNNLVPRPRNHFALPVMYVNGREVGSSTLRNEGVYVETANPAFDFGTGDYTLEGWFRWRELPALSEKQILMGVWDEDQDDRSYALSLKGGNVDDGGLQFEYSSDGTATNSEILHDVKWEPQVGVWYHIAVVRDSTGDESRLFIDGVQQGNAQTDAAVYNTGSVPFVVGNGWDEVNSSFRASPDVYPLLGFVQGVRVTKGVARYATNFTPPSQLWPENSSADPDFSSVELLLQFDDATEDPPVDHSSNAFTMVATDNAKTIDFADTAFSFLAAGTTDPFDDRYLESALPKAKSVLTGSGNAANDDTVTVDTDTFTFKTSLTGTANEILIGTDLVDTLANLAAAINSEAGSGTKYTAGTTTTGTYTALLGVPTAGQLTVEAVLGGAAGNAFASTETSATLSFDGTTFSGGADLPGPSEFGVESLPPDATGVRWVAIRHRSYVTEGTATLETKLDVSGAESDASSEALTNDPQYYTQRVEEDPDTTAALTVNSIENAKIKIERTA